MIRLAIIRRAIDTLSELLSKPTPEKGVVIEQGADEIKKIGHALNGLAATIIGAITISDFELLYTWWSRDKVFFVIVLLVMQAPYIVATYLKLAGKSQSVD